jgi:hydroxyethylthiazole kinase-like uncharacterized protein yjeF
MRYAYDVASVRAAEQELMARLPEGALMQRAAAGLARVAGSILGQARGGVYGSRVLLLVGVGDNGGDALYAGGLLAGRGAAVHAVLADPSRAHAGGLAALREAGGRIASAGAARALADRADLVLDGLLGIGGRGGLRGVFAELAEAAHAAVAGTGAPIVAVDLPSGVDADTGEVSGTAIRAAVTVTFGTLKPGLLLDPAAAHTGILELVDIGLDPRSAAPVLEVLQEPDVRALLPEPERLGNKYSRGVVGLSVGSERYPGAALLAAGAALRSGVGAVRYEGPVDVVSAYPEVLLGAGRVQAWVVGSGFGQGDEARERLARVLESDVPVLIDADGLRLLPKGRLERTAPTLLTPHSGEAAVLLGSTAAQVDARRLAAVRDLARTYDATVLLKGAFSLIADPRGGVVRVNTHASAHLATAGSGDVLAGLAGGLMAGGLSLLDAASAAAYLHGAAGLLAARSGPVAAGDLVAALPRAWQNVAG